MRALKEKFRSWYSELMHESVSSHAIASGAAIGTFVAFLPTPGFNILLGFLVLMLYPKANKIALLGALAVWNPLTVAPFYVVSYKIGNFLFASEPVIKYNVVILDHLYNFSRRFLVGNLLVALAAGIGTYLVIRGIVKYYKK